MESNKGQATKLAREEVEDRFLDAAERLLVEVGPRRASRTRRLAEEAGANHGLVHYYFGSMENLLVRVLERFTDRLIARQRRDVRERCPVHREVADRDALPRRRPRLPEGLVRAPGARLEPPRAARAGRPRRRRVARRADRGASPSPWSATGSPIPLDALVSLVATLQRGDHPRAPLGDRDRPRGAARLDRRLARASRRQTRDHRDAPRRRSSSRAPATRTRRATSSATACGSSTRSTATASRRSCCCRRGRSSTRAIWKLQIPYLARHFRVVTFDGRGNGRSDRPHGHRGLRRAAVRRTTRSR